MFCNVKFVSLDGGSTLQRSHTPPQWGRIGARSDSNIILSGIGLTWFWQDCSDALVISERRYRSTPVSSLGCHLHHLLSENSKLNCIFWWIFLLFLNHCWKWAIWQLFEYHKGTHLRLLLVLFIICSILIIMPLRTDTSFYLNCPSFFSLEIDRKSEETVSSTFLLY